MPWNIRKTSSCPPSKPYGIIKEGESKARWCHSSKASAENQRRALHAQEGKSMSDETKTVEQKDQDDKALGPYAPLHGATSFNEAEELQHVEMINREIHRLNWTFQDLVSNVLDDDEIPDKPAAITALVAEYSQRLVAIPQEAPKKGFFKSIADFFGRKEVDPYELTDGTEEKRTGPAMKREANIDFPARDYAYVPDPQRPATWKLRLTESPGKVSIRQLGKAAKALSTGGFGGKKLNLPPAVLSSVKRRIRQEYRKLGVAEKDIPAAVKIDDAQPRQKSTFFVLKDNNNEYRWFSVYSNNYRDDDTPPEIITEASHKTFVKAVDEGVFPMPELWIWHYDHPVGDADWLDFTSGGLALASGTFRKGYEETAEKLAKYPEPLLTSHGMPTQYLVRDQDDPSIIWFHVTKEISPLPAWAAANKLTGFVVLSKEQEMAISDEKQSMLRNVLPEGLFDELNTAVEAAEGKAAEEDRESKEATEAEADTEDKETPEADEPQYVTAEEIAEALGEVLNPMVKGLSALTERLAGLEATVKEIQVAEKAKEDEAKEETPRSSVLAELLAGQLSPVAQVKEGEKTPGPKETPPPQDGTGLPFIDQLIANSQGAGG
jgi:hypothetical protein